MFFPAPHICSCLWLGASCVLHCSFTGCLLERSLFDSAASLLLTLPACPLSSMLRLYVVASRQFRSKHLFLAMLCSGLLLLEIARSGWCDLTIAMSSMAMANRMTRHSSHWFLSLFLQAPSSLAEVRSSFFFTMPSGLVRLFIVF